MSSSTSILASLISGFATFLTFAVEISLLVIPLTTVRSRRPDAAMPLVIGASVHAIATILQSITYAFVVPSLARSGSIESLPTIYAVIGFVFTVFHLVGWGAILFGIVKLANPQRPADPTRYS